MSQSLMEKYKGREANLTFHGGWDIGYLLGKIAVLESIFDELDVSEELPDA